MLIDVPLIFSHIVELKGFPHILSKTDREFHMKGIATGTCVLCHGCVAYPNTHTWLACMMLCHGGVATQIGTHGQCATTRMGVI